MAVARTIFTLGGWVQLFWTVFDLMFSVVPLKVALGWHKFYFWAFQKIIMQVGVKCDIMIIFLKHPKNNFLYPNAIFNGTPVTGISKTVQNNWARPPKVNIDWATAISLKQNPKKSEKLEKILFFFKQMAVAHSIFTLCDYTLPLLPFHIMRYQHQGMIPEAKISKFL